MELEVDRAQEVDGRTARRDRNRVVVLDAVLELFSEGNLTPTPDDVARRSGISLRSVYRYVADSDDLIRAAIARHTEKVAPLFAIDGIGEGPFEHRLDAFVATRLRVYEAIASTARASRLRAPANEIIRDQLDSGRRLLRAQLERQFAPELGRLETKSRRAVVAAADALTQIETIDLYRHHRRCSSSETREMLLIALRALLVRKY
jgi:AcrR family transcriptional regulator